jgi:hypothetical protein
MVSVRGADLEKPEGGPISSKAEGDDVRTGDGVSSKSGVLPGLGYEWLNSDEPVAMSGHHWNTQDSFS